MAQYIDKAAVVAEIEKRKNENLECATKACQGYYGARAMEDINILSCLDTLEVKEVDLEKYYHEFLQKEWFGNPHVRTVSEMMSFTAKHFFELGIKAKVE